MAQDDLMADGSRAPLSASTSGRPARRALLVVQGTVIGLAIGVGLAGWFAWRSGIDVEGLVTGHSFPDARSRAEWNEGAPRPTIALNTTEARVSGLEARLNVLDQQARAAAANAGRAEALLIAFSARRAIERGAPLGYLEDQLKLRFGDALPHAVGTVLAAARQPVTLDQLVLGLDELAAQSAGVQPENGWAKVRRQISGLFVIHDAPEGSTNKPAQQLAQVRLMLREGRIDSAISAVRTLPLARRDDWIAAASRYQDTQRALDLLETTSLVEPRELVDGAGRKVPVPSPVPPPMATPGK